MLSILIPIFNQDVRPLVQDLSEQCMKEKIRFQILCFDDGSKEKYKKINRSVESAFGVSYLEFRQNVGRSKIRNKLAFNAMYDNLLFLDCDSEIASKKFIKKYKKAITAHTVIYGGTMYSKRKPRSLEKMLHWKYGQKRERAPVEKRNKHPYDTFRSNNFVMDRDLFLSVRFNEEIEGYGHEDTLFAQQLKEQEISLHHVDNPVIHGGLEKVETYLAKVDESIRNLVELNRGKYRLSTRLTKTYEKIKSWNLWPVISWLAKRYDNRYASALTSKNPNLRLLDLYKLASYHKCLDANTRQ